MAGPGVWDFAQNLATQQGPSTLSVGCPILRGREKDGGSLTSQGTSRPPSSPVLRTSKYRREMSLFEMMEVS